MNSNINYPVKSVLHIFIYLGKSVKYLITKLNEKKFLSFQNWIIKIWAMHLKHIKIIYLYLNSPPAESL